jgi:hypothetical protein
LLSALRPPRRPYARYSPYRKLDRDFTFDSSDSFGLEYAQLIREESSCNATSGTPCRPSPVDDVTLGSSVPQLELETELAVCVNSRESEEEVTFPGAYPIEEVVYASDESCIVSCGLPSLGKDAFLGCGIQGSIISKCELETGLAIRVDLGEPEADYQEKELTFPGTYPIELVVCASDEPAKRIAEVAQKQDFEAKVSPCPTVHPSAQYGLRESFCRLFAHLFDW